MVNLGSVDSKHALLSDWEKRSIYHMNLGTRDEKRDLAASVIASEDVSQWKDHKD